MSFCSNCGNELNTGDIFCPKCGKKVGNKKEKKIKLANDPIEYFFDGLRKYFSLNGRSSLKEFWFYMLYVSIIYFAFCVINFVTSHATSGIMEDLFGADKTVIEIIHLLINDIFIVGITLPTISIAVRRMHDSNKTGWFILCPIINIIFLCHKSKEEDNKYSEDTKKYLIGKIVAISWVVLLFIASIIVFFI